MSEVRLVSPMLDNFALGDAISNHNGVRCYPAMRADSEERYIVKTISIPASQVQLDALLLTGAYPNAEAAKDYFKNLANGIRSEIQVLDKLAAQRGFLPYLNHQIVPMEDATGYDVYLLSPYKMTLERYLRHKPLTHLSAVNMGIDLCAALTICRENGYLYVDLKPENIVLSGDQNYHIADLGFIALNALKYSSLPDRYRSRYTPPEITDAFSTLNTTMDTYALGLVLYQVFNNGEMPPEAPSGTEIVPPVYADYEMAEIILKAISPDPEQRWTDPTEMGKALIAYMQRNTVNDVLIGPPIVEELELEPEEPTAEESEENEAGEETASDEECPEQTDRDETDTSSEETEDATASTEGSEETDPVEEATEEEAASEEGAPEPTEETESEASNGEDTAEKESEEPAEAEDSEASEDAQEAPQGDWIDVMQNIIAEDGDGEANPDEPALRDLLSDNGDSPSGEEADENATLTEETAGILNQAQELIDHETPDPVVAPDPIDVPMPEPIVLEDDDKKEQEKEDGETEGGEKESRKIIFSDDEDEENSESDKNDASKDATSEQSDAPVKKKRGVWKKVLKITAALVVVCGLLAGAYIYYTEIYRQSVSSFSVSGEADTIVVHAETSANPELLTVICQDTYGNVATSKLVDGTATFDQLKPASQYTITMKIDGFHELVGLEPLTYATPARTQILNLNAVTGTEDGSVILNFAVEGPDSEEWTLSYSSENTEAQSVSFTGHTVTVTGLTIGETYTFTLSGDESVYLMGENSIDYTVRDVVLAQNLMVNSNADNTLNVSWSAPEGEEVPSWTAHCYNEEGYDQVLQTQTNSVSFPDINSESAYTIEVVAQGMTQSARLFVTPNPITIKNLDASVSGSTISLSWEFDGKAPEGGWIVQASVDGSSEHQTFKSENAKLTISPVAPGSHYDLVIQAADSSSVFGGTASVDVPAYTQDFANYGLSRSLINVFSYHAPEKENWRHWDLTLEDASTTFRPGEDIALIFYTSSIYQVSGEDVTTLVVFRNADGKAVAINSSTRIWSDMWEGGYCEVECDQVPTAPGTYTMEVFLNDGILASQEITISE